MMRHWTKFPGRPHGRFRKDGVRVTIGPKGVIHMNAKAWALLGRPRAVEMMFDKPSAVIGLIPADPDQIDEAFPVKDKKGSSSKQIFASAFCTHFLIKMMRTGQFNEVEIEDGVMTLALPTVSAVGRGAR